MILDSFNICLPCCYGLFLCLLLGGVSAEDVEATVGVDVTLVCKYDAKYYGRLAVCWGRGAIPNSGCTDEVLRSDGTTVTSRLSERYLLMGDLGEGDVSLVIRQVQESDSGVYGCRVDIPGWFNDHKHQLTLTVVPAPPRPLRVEAREVKERVIGVSWTGGFDGGSPVTGYRVDVKSRRASWDTAVTTAGISPTQSQVTLIGMRPAEAYNIRMFAINSVGMSEASNVLTVITKEAAPEGPPLDVQLQALSPRAIKVTWKPPSADLHNGVLRSYSISYKEESDSPGQQWHRIIMTARAEVTELHGLKPSTNYSVLIQARTAAGIGPPSSSSLCSTLDEVPTTSTAETTLAATVWGQSSTSITAVPPDPPIVRLVSVNDKAVTLHWTAGFDGGSPITAYELEYKEGKNGSWDSYRSVREASDLREMTIIETHYSTLFYYNIRMFARNSVGCSEASNMLTVVTPGRPAPAPCVLLPLWKTLKRKPLPRHRALSPSFFTCVSLPNVTTSAPGGTYHTTTSSPLGQATTQDGERGNFSTTISTDAQASASVEGGRSGHLAAIVVPVVLVVLIVAMVTAWQLHRMKVNKGSSPLAWLASGSLRYRNSEPITEL